MRKTSVVSITDGSNDPKDADYNRDYGKTFLLREMPAAVAERWATKALLALARSGINLPDGAASAGWAGIAVLGFQALSHASFDDIQPLLNEMWQCVSVIPDMRHPQISRALMWAGPDGEGADIDEVATMLKLRAEVFTLHSGFSLPGVGSTSSSSTISTSADLPNMKTSTPSTAGPLRRHSPPGKRR
jgi:hypothetical protein